MLYKKTNRINKLLVLYNFPGLPTNTGEVVKREFVINLDDPEAFIRRVNQREGKIVIASKKYVKQAKRLFDSARSGKALWQGRCALKHIRFVAFGFSLIDFSETYLYIDEVHNMLEIIWEKKMPDFYTITVR